MRNEDMKAGMIVKHRSGKLYRCTLVKPPMPPEDVAQCIAQGYGCFNRTWHITFVGQRNGRNFGPIRHLKTADLELVTE